MTEHIYAFGSLCRGEADASSDIDLLACISSPQKNYDPENFSIYTHSRIRELWMEGNPFSWHLHLESKLIFSSDGVDFIADLGSPSPYLKAAEDCHKFHRLFSESYESLKQSEHSRIFHLSCMFLAARNFAMCYSLNSGKPNFSRRAPLQIDPPLNVSPRIYDLYSRSRILSTRGYGAALTEDDVRDAINSAPIILSWMNGLITEGIAA